MKNKINLLKYAFSICLSFAILGVTGCSNDDETITRYIKVSDRSFTIDPSGLAVVSIDIETNADAWYPTMGNDWLEVVEMTENNIKIKASVNLDGDARTGKVLFTAGPATDEVIIEQVGLGSAIPDEYGNLPSMKIFLRTEWAAYPVISTNGRYLIAWNWRIDYENPGNHRYIEPVLYDLVEDTETELPTIYNRTAEGDRTMGMMYIDWITDTGTFCVRMTGGTVLFDINGFEFDAPMSGDFTDLYIDHMNADGTVWIGDGYDSNGERQLLRVTNGVPEVLPRIYTTFHGAAVTGIGLSGISANGKTIWGGINPEGGLYWDESNNVHVVGEDSLRITDVIMGDGSTEPYLSTSRAVRWPTCGSNNGRFLTTQYQWYPYGQSYVQAMDGVNMGLVYDIEEKKTHILDIYSGNLSIGMGVSDEGVACMDNGCMYDVRTESYFNSMDYVKQNYGISLNKNVVIERFCTDGKTIAGHMNDAIRSITSEKTCSGFVIYYPKK